MKSTRRTASRAAVRVGRRRRRGAAAAGPYHHGSLREAGVSHAAPKNHFGDVSGLLSELAALGFARFGDALVANTRGGETPRARLAAIGRGYVTFAQRNPGLFLLMFRGERLDFSRPA